jgi:hypothetical protein
VAVLSAGSPVDWANDTHAQAVSVTYGALPENPDEDLAGAYARAALPSSMRIPLIVNGHSGRS